jgi:histidinol-phosphatase (PHP family)
MPADYHMHTPLCRHAEGAPTEYAARAVALGLTEIGFSDHAPMPRDDFDDWRMRLDQLDEYVGQVRQAQREHPGLAIRLALEVDYLPGEEDWVRELAARHPWDYFIGSVHYVSGGWDVDSPFKRELWQTCDVDAVWAEYCERLRRAAASGLFEILGHADLPKKFGYRPHRDLAELFAPVFAAARATDTAIELNTAGLRKDCVEIYPSAALLRLAQAHGVAITFGSDAHHPMEVGHAFAAAVDLARSAGYREWRSFERREARSHPLGEPVRTL